MLDTGSEINIMKIGSVSSTQIINTDQTVLLKGIDTTILPTIGTVEIKILNHMVTFHIVPEEFCIPFNGMLGLEYFLQTKAMLNFETRQLTIGERSMKFKQNEKLPFELEINGISKWNKNSTSILSFIDILNPPSDSYGQFMIDTGSEANIIKRDLLPTEIDINNYETILLKGVGDKSQNTMGSIEIAIYGKTTTFLIVTDNFDIPCEGILGVNYPTETGAIIDYGNGTIQIGETIANLKCRTNSPNFA